MNLFKKGVILTTIILVLFILFLPISGILLAYTDKIEYLFPYGMVYLFFGFLTTRLNCPKCGNNIFAGKYFIGPIPHEICADCGLHLNKSFSREELDEFKVKKIKGNYNKNWFILAVFLYCTILVGILVYFIGNRKPESMDIIKSNNKSELFLATIPPAAEIFINDSFAGKSNIDIIRMNPGNYKIRIVKDTLEKDTMISFLKGKNQSALIRLEK